MLTILREKTRKSGASKKIGALAMALTRQEKMSRFDFTTDPQSNFEMDQTDRFFQSQSHDFTEDFLDNMVSTPIGKLLSMIASLPEVRGEKVNEIKTRLNSGSYNVNKKLNTAMDRILEELLIED